MTMSIISDAVVISLADAWYERWYLTRFVNSSSSDMLKRVRDMGSPSSLEHLKLAIQVDQCNTI